MSEDPTAWARVGPQVVFGMDRYGVCTLSAGPGLAALGYADGELVGTSLLELYRDDPALLSSIHRALAGDTFAVTREIEGRTMCVCYRATVDASGLFTGSLAVATDVTEQLADAERAAEFRRRAATLAELSRALGDADLSPAEVLDVGVRIIGEALAEAAVGWLVVDAEDGGERLDPVAVWHADEEVRRRLREGFRPAEDSGWRDPARVRSLRDPVTFVSDPAARPRSRSQARRLVDDLGLRYGLRMPLRSRGRTIGAADFVRGPGSGPGRGPFDEQDVEFAQEVADRFTLAHDNALLLAEQRSVLQTLLKFQALADASDDLIVIADDRGRAGYLNPRLRTAGLEMPNDDVWAGVASYFGPERTAQMRASMDAGRRWRGDVALPVPPSGAGAGAGEELLVHTEAIPLAGPETGEPLGFAWIAQDVTQLRAAERRLRQANAELSKFQALVEASHDFIAIARLDGAVDYVNPHGRAMVGLGPDDDVTHTTIADYLTPAGLEQSLAVEQPAVRERGSWEGVSTLRRQDGGPPIPVAIASFLMHDLVTGEPFALATVQRDMTEQMSAQRSLQRLSEHRQALLERLVEAQETERAKIAGDVHDDPVQALAAVDLRLGLLLRRIEEHAPQLLDVVRAVQETVAAANERLRALLFDLEAPELDRGLAPALERAADEMFRDSGTHVSVVGDDEPPADAGSRTVAYRIAREALMNARKHASARHVWVTLHARDGGLAVEVADDGVGLGAGPVRSAPGHNGVTGMRDRASIAGGVVEFADRPGGGALVRIWLPGVHRTD